jgi:hypothetical protein
LKKILIILAAVMTAVTFVLSSITIYTWYQSSKYEKTAIPYVKMAVPEISEWNPDKIIDLMPLESLKKTPKEDIIKIVSYLSRLGTLLKMEEPEFSKVFSGATVAGVQNTLVSYTVDAEYESGEAVITINLLDLGDSFKVYNFHFNSLALAQ